MKHGLTVPPIEAPVLPTGYFYRITTQCGEYGDSPNWFVRIMRSRRFCAKRIVCGWSGSYGEPTEGTLTQTCERAYGKFVEIMDSRLLADKYTGDWSGQ